MLLDSRSAVQLRAHPATSVNSLTERPRDLVPVGSGFCVFEFLSVHRTRVKWEKLSLDQSGPYLISIQQKLWCMLNVEFPVKSVSKIELDKSYFGCYFCNLSFGRPRVLRAPVLLNEQRFDLCGRQVRERVRRGWSILQKQFSSHNS